MKKFIACLVLVSLMLSIVATVAVARTRRQEMKAVKAYVKSLEAKKRGARRPARIRKIEEMIKAQNRRLRKLEVEVDVPGGRPVIPGGKKPVRPMAKQARTEIGVVGGMLASMIGGGAEIRFHNPFDLISTTLRITGNYAQGTDSDSVARRHVIMGVDWMYRLNPPHTRGIKSYVGLGANYNVYTSGRVSGTLGGQAFYGVEGSAGGGNMFFEVGYGLVRTGFSPNFMGINAIVGYRVGL